MNVSEIELTPKEAKDKLEAYRSRMHKDVEEQYRAASIVYEVIAGGGRVLDLVPAIREAPRDERGRPKLAVARADRQEVRLHLSPYRSIVDYYTGQDGNAGRYPGLRVEVDIGQRIVKTWTEGYARVPMIPADVRPERGQRRKWHILWEVEQWADHSTLEPPRDPYLLKHLIGPLYEIIAEWELTEVERSVMRFVL